MGGHANVDCSSRKAYIDEMKCCFCNLMCFYVQMCIYFFFQLILCFLRSFLFAKSMHLFTYCLLSYGKNCLKRKNNGMGVAVYEMKM